MKIKNNIVVVGIGGIGTAVIEPLFRYVQYSMKTDEPITVKLVDGDIYEPKNLERQRMLWDDIRQNKAEVHAKRLGEEFDNLEIQAVPEYVTRDNVSSIIENGDLVFLGVDNHKTRKMVADYCAQLDDVVVISGGNELTDGNVILFIKENGKKLTANLDEYHPEIAYPQDKHPDELSCEDQLKINPQILFMNLQIATLMLITFYNVIQSENWEDFGEVYTDIKLCKTDTADRAPLAAR